MSNVSFSTVPLMPALSRASSSDSVDSAPPRTPPAVDSQPQIFGADDDFSLALVDEEIGKGPKSPLIPRQNIAIPQAQPRKSVEDSEREFLAEFECLTARPSPPPPRSAIFNFFLGVYNFLHVLCHLKNYAMQAVAVAQLAFYGATIVFKMRRGMYKPSDSLSGWLFEAFCSFLAVFVLRFAVMMTKLGLICLLAIWIYRVYFS
ncbi:hypothetical protein EXIGLDRAFT_784165 [Exidia glandulosa HHB12029]|uniref:Uncharacterized protein n=1 Tax=Exidia glandulosa HHB12029 TaxID=1314781 RepID=A0A166MMV2_EXIGL|nr:hypothetical protein EXIGLDRAFT_784165 [Exidia glandulosa HHB12029]